MQCRCNKWCLVRAAEGIHCGNQRDEKKVTLNAALVLCKQVWHIGRSLQWHLKGAVVRNTRDIVLLGLLWCASGWLALAALDLYPTLTQLNEPKRSSVLLDA